MSKPGQQPKSGAPRAPPTKPQRHVTVQAGPRPSTVARLWPYIQVGVALVMVGFLLVALERSAWVQGMLIRMGWKDAPATTEAQ